MFWEHPNGSGTGSTVLFYLAERITSLVGAYVITITIFRQDPSIGNLARDTSSQKLDILEN